MERTPEIMAEVTELLTRFGIAAQLFQTEMEKRLAPFGLTLAQLSVLSHLARRQGEGAPPQRVTQIARAVEVQQPAVTKMVAKFEGAGWVALIADPEDRRAKAVRITPQGLQHLGQLRRGLFPELGQWLAGWPAAQRARFTEDLRAFGGFFEAARNLDDVL